VGGKVVQSVGETNLEGFEGVITENSDVAQTGARLDRWEVVEEKAGRRNTGTEVSYRRRREERILMQAGGKGGYRPRKIKIPSARRGEGLAVCLLAWYRVSLVKWLSILKRPGKTLGLPSGARGGGGGGGGGGLANNRGTTESALPGKRVIGATCGLEGEKGGGSNHGHTSRRPGSADPRWDLSHRGLSRYESYK